MTEMSLLGWWIFLREEWLIVEGIQWWVLLALVVGLVRYVLCWSMLSLLRGCIIVVGGGAVW